MEAIDINKVAITDKKVTIHYYGDRQVSSNTYKDRPNDAFLEVYNKFRKAFEVMAELELEHEDYEVNFVRCNVDKHMNRSFMIGISRNTSKGHHNLQTPLVAEDLCHKEISELWEELQVLAHKFHHGDRVQLNLFEGSENDKSDDQDNLSTTTVDDTGSLEQSSGFE